MRVTRHASGTLKRLNAAVVVNHRVTTDAKGKSTSTPLPAEELEKITALVQQSVGFDKERGDSVRVINAPFRVEAAPRIEPLPIYQQPWLLDVVADNASGAALPSSTAMALSGPAGAAANTKLDHARAFAQQNPAVVAQIVKDWVGSAAA